MTARKTPATAPSGTTRGPAAPKAGTKTKGASKPKGAVPAAKRAPGAKAPAKEAAVKPAAPRNVAKKAMPAPAIEARPVGANPVPEHLGMIAVAAYYRAERRGFAPGGELEDWIEAEAEIERLLGLR